MVDFPLHGRRHLKLWFYKIPPSDWLDLSLLRFGGHLISDVTWGKSGLLIGLEPVTWYFPGSWLVTSKISPFLNRRGLESHFNSSWLSWKSVRPIPGPLSRLFGLFSNVTIYFYLLRHLNFSTNQLLVRSAPLRLAVFNFFFPAWHIFLGVKLQHSTHSRQTLRLLRWRPFWMSRGQNAAFWLV